MGTLKGLCLIQWLLVVLSEWSRVQEFGIPKPSARSVHVAVFDPTINQFWIHGGSSDGVLPDLWSFDFDTGTWDRKQQLTQSPSPRGDHVAVWDSDDYALWLHGGYDGVSYFDDLWRYSSYRWTNIMVGGPSARSQHVAVWDASNRAIWIHGGLFDCSLKQDLWKFDTRQGTWSQMPESGNQPSARSNHVAAWDSANLALWIHAGYDRSSCGGNPQGGLQQDLWRYDTTVSSNNWNLIYVGGPPARAFHVAGWDPTNRALWIHGGFDGGSFCRDLWRFDVENYAWHLITDKDDGPSPRFNHAAAFDVTTTSLCIHGGYSEGRLQDDLWCYLVTTTTTSQTASSSTTTSFSTSSTVTSTVTFTTTSSRSSTSTTSSTSRSSSSTSTLTTSSSTSTRSSTSSTTGTSSTSKSSTRTTSSTTSSSITATRSTSSTSTTSSTTVSTTTTSSHTETATTSTTTLSFTSTTTGSTTTTTSTSLTTSSTTTSSTTTSSTTSSTSISSSTTISRTTTTSHTATTTSITLTTSTTSSTKSSTTTVTSTSTSSTTMSTTTSSTSTTTLSTTSTSSFSTTSSSISTSSTTGTSSTSISFTTTTSTSITFTTSSITTTSTSLTTSSSTSSTRTSSSSTQTTSTRTTRTTSSSTGTRTTSTSSTITTTTTTVEDLTAIYILFPLVGLAVIITTTSLLWLYLRYLRLKRAIVVPLQPSEKTVETVLTIAPLPPECVPAAPECEPPYPPHPPEPPDPPDCHPPPMNFQVLHHPPALPLPCPPHPGRLPQQPSPLPDLTHLESLPQRHLCINIPGQSSTSPQRPVSINQCPSVTRSSERPACRIVPMSPRSPRSPRLRRLREPLPTQIQPPLRTPPSRPSGASCDIVSLQPEPLLEPNLQEQMVCNCIVVVPALGEAPCLNSDWWSESQEPCSQFYGENHIASIDPTDMWPRLDHVLLIARGQQDATEAPSLLRGHGEVCTAAPRRSLPDVQPAPILNEPAQNPISRSCSEAGDATPPNRRRSGHRPGRQRERDRMPGPGFYNTEPDPNQYGWIPGRQPAFPRERRRYS